MNLISWRPSRHFILTLLVILTSCTDPKVLLSTEFDTFPNLDSTLLYEYSDVSSGATGDCIGTFMNRWYGTSMGSENIKKLYLTFFSKNGWEIRPEEVVQMWSKENEGGLYSAGLSTFTDPTAVSQEQGHYKLPNSILQEFTHYPTIYLLHMSFRYPRAAEKCFGNLD